MIEECVMTTDDREEEWRAAQLMLEGVGMAPRDVVLLILELVQGLGGRGRRALQRARQCIALGKDLLQRQQRSVAFKVAVEASLEARKQRRPRTLHDISYMASRAMRKCPGLARRPISTITADECLEILERAFHTDRQRFKARSILGSVFTYAKRKGWCLENPMERVDLPELVEHEICPLTLEQIERLRTVTMADSDVSCCGPALGLMLYAGIRPAEVERLSWEDVDLTEKLIRIRPIHSKTGGVRHVTIYPVLERWLRGFGEGRGKICPPAWKRRWRHLRRLAGWGIGEGLHAWPQDVLRHTFASYHAKHFRNLEVLQLEMGHHSTALLRTRYLNMRGITAQKAELFWAM